MIKTVVFDVGNVLERFDPDRMLRLLVPDTSERAGLENRIFGSPTWLMLDRGSIDEDAAAVKICEGETERLEAVRRVIGQWTALMEPFSGSVALLKRLRAEGFQLYILSNYNNVAFWRVAWHAQLPALVDGIMLSADEELLKPDPALFRRLASRFDLEPVHTLFLDDSAANVEAAAHVGFKTLHVREPKKLETLQPNGNI